MIAKKADSEWYKFYMKENKFLTIVDDEMYIVDSKHYRKLSEKELYHIGHYCLHEVVDNKFVFEDIDVMEAYPIIQLANKVKKRLMKRYPDELSKKQKKEIVRIFRGGYFLKLSVYLDKNKDGGFKEIHKLVLKDMLKEKAEYKGGIFNLIEEKDLRIVQKETEKYLYNMIDWLDVVPLGSSVRLKIKKGKIVFKIVKELYKYTEIKDKKFYDSI